MATCPNINLDSWKTLVAARGEDMAYYLWDKHQGNVPSSEYEMEKQEIVIEEPDVPSPIVRMGLKSVNALQSEKAISLFKTLEKNKVKGDAFWNKIQSDLQIPKEQMDLLKSFGTTNREELITNMLADYSYAIEINTATTKVLKPAYLDRPEYEDTDSAAVEEFTLDGVFYRNHQLADYPTKGYDYERITDEEFKEAKNKFIKSGGNPTSYYSNLTVPGGTNYTENEIATPAITPAIKGHAQFATDKGIGWFRSDEQVEGGELIEYDDDKRQRTIQESRGGTPTKTRRILEVQSDLFQKGRDKKDLIEQSSKTQYGYSFRYNGFEYEYDEVYKDFAKRKIEDNQFKKISKEEFDKAVKDSGFKIGGSKENQFLQLLNQGSNWVTFFVKSIIQDSAKKGYEKVLFPSGDTASKVEGHESLEEFKKQKEDRIKELEELKQRNIRINKGAVSPFLTPNSFENEQTRIDREITQLKQELERIEKEGFGALRPIFKFYEENVANVLKKQGYNPLQITDEYGNTWNEISIKPVRDVQPIMLQLEGKLETSAVSPETLSVIKDFLKRIGVDIKTLQEIVVNGVKQDANGAAAIIQKLVMVVEGKENIALPEEAMHFAVELIEQRDPALFKKLMKEINSYRMYNAVVADYGKLKEYQTADGKPDIRKLKKEAIAKVLTEVVIKKNEGFTEKPENLARVQSWWQEIINFFKGLFSTSGFDKAAMMVLKGEALGTVEDIRLDDEIYLQSSLTPQQRIVDKIRSISAMIEKPKSEKESYKINGKPIKNRVTNISKNWLQNRFDDKQLTKDDFDKAVDDLLKEKGTMLHGEHDWMLKNHFLDSEGKFIKDAAKRPNDDNYVSQLSPLDKTFYEQLKKSMEDRLSEFYEKDPNTIFLAETTVYDPKRDLAGTIDFIAVESSGKTHILDWKFKRISNVELQDDIPWYDVISWRTQMKNYKSILSNAYGVTFDGSEQTRMVPFRAIYTKADKKKNIKPQLIGLEIGAVDPKKEERSYLVPVGLEEERTGIKRIDSLIEKLNEIYEIISSKKASPEKKKEKAEQLNALYKAIRQLKMRQNLKPLIQQAGVINKSVNSLIDEYYNYWDGKEPFNFTEDERSEFSARINDFEKSLIVYSTLYKELRPLFQGELSEEQKSIKEELRDVTEEANELQIRLEEVKEKFGEGIIAKSVNILEYLKPEKIVKGITKWLGTTSTLQIKSIQVLFRMADNAYAKAAMDTQSEGQLLLSIKSKYDRWAKSRGLTNKNYFDIIKKKPGYNKEAVEDKRKEALDDLALRKTMFTEEEYKKEKDRLNEKYDKELKGKNELIDEYNPKFYNTLRKSVKDRDFEWIKKNVDVDAYKEHLKRKKEEEINRANNKTRHGSEFSINKQKADDIAKIEMLYDTTSAEGLGWLQYDDVKKFPISNWKSEEWKELYKKDGSGNYINAPAIEFYEYIKNRNEYFEDIGYISPKQERTFLPYVRKSLMEKIVMGGNVTLFEGALRSISVDEGDVGYGQTDPITKKPIYTIPKYFTRDTGEEMSNDLFKNLTLINEAAIRYKYLSEVENQVHLIANIESSKKAIKTSYFGKTKMSADGEPELTNDNTENTRLFNDMMEAIIYGHKYVESQNFDQILGSIGNFGKKANEKLGMKIFPEEFNNSQISLNKSLDWLNNAFQLKALGLNPLSSIATYLGGSFQSYINAGKYFTKTEFAKNEFLLAQRMHGVDAKKYIGALQYFLPLTENNNIMMAKKLSLSKLSQEGVQDALMFLMRKADQTVQTVNFFSFLDNTIVLDGQLVNVREYLRSTPEYSNIYSLSGKERRDKDAKFEEDVKSLIAEKGVFNVAEVKGDDFIIPGVERKSDTVINLRRKVQGITKDALGNLSATDVRLINLNIYGKSFMMFKNWIPRLVDVRMGNLKYNSATDAYEWGRTRMMMRWLMDEKLRVFKTLKGAITGDTEVFVQQMKELYERKKADYEKDTGKTLMMTEDEFVQLAAQNIRNQMVDFLFYLALTGLWFAAKGLKGDGDDEDRLTRNRYNYMLRAIDKVRDEVAFFYDPTQALSLSKSGIFPSLSLIDNYIKLFSNFANEMYALSIDDEKEADKNYVIKYLLKGFPVTSQFDAIFLTFYPDLAKDLGIKSQTEARPVGR